MPGLRWLTYYAPLADLLHAIGRLITRHWPTYYTPMADLLHTLGRLIACRSDARRDAFRRQRGFAGRPWQPTRILATSGTDPVSAGRLMTRRGRLMTWCCQVVPGWVRGSGLVY